MTRCVRLKTDKQSSHVRNQYRKTRRVQKQRGGLVSSLRMIQLLDIMDRRFLTKVESNGFETNEKILYYIKEHPEEVNEVDKNGYTPYHWILRYARYPASLLTYILPYVADPNVPRITTVLGRKESPILLLCQNKKRLQSMNTVLFVYKQLGKELTIGGKETGEFKTVCDRDEKIVPEPFVNSPFPLHKEPAALNNQPSVNRAVLSNQPPVTSTRKQKNVGSPLLHIALNGTKSPFTNIVSKNVPLPNTRRFRRDAIVSSIVSPPSSSRSSRANSTNTNNSTNNNNSTNSTNTNNNTKRSIRPSNWKPLPIKRQEPLLHTGRFSPSAIVSSIFSPPLNSRSNRANSTNSTISWRLPNWMSMSTPRVSEINVPPVNTSQMSTIQLIEHGTPVNHTSNVQSVLSENHPTRVNLNPHASTSNNLGRGSTTFAVNLSSNPAVSPTSSEHIVSTATSAPASAPLNLAVSPNPHAGVGIIPGRTISNAAKLPNPHAGVGNIPPGRTVPNAPKLPNPQFTLAYNQPITAREVISPEDKEIIQTTRENIAKIKSIILPKLKEFIQTGLCNTIPPRYSGILSRKLVTPETYEIKTPNEILNAATAFILDTLAHMSKITADDAYPVIKTSFPKLGYSNNLIWTQLPSAAVIRNKIINIIAMTTRAEAKTAEVKKAAAKKAEVKKAETKKAEVKKAEVTKEEAKKAEEKILELIQTIVNPDSINCIANKIDDETADAIVKKVLQNLFIFINPDIFNETIADDTDIQAIRYFMVKVIHPKFSLSVKLKKLIKETAVKKANAETRKKAGETLNEWNTHLLESNPEAMIPRDLVDKRWHILYTAKEELTKLQREYS